MARGEKAPGSGVADGYILYLYGVISGDQDLPTTSLAQVEAIPFSTLAAIVEPVLATDFLSETLDAKLQSVDWVAPLARKHNTVLEEAMHYGPVIPARLCTLFSDAGSLTKQLAKNEQRFAKRLQWLRGRQEWDVKVFCNEEMLRSTLGSTAVENQAIEAAEARGNTGLAYVLRKKCDNCLTEAVSTRIDEVVDSWNEAIAFYCVEYRTRALLSEASTGRKEAMISHAALLIDLDAHDPFHAEMSRLASQMKSEGFFFEFTGPWPPYSFCEEGTSEDIDMDEPSSGATE